jgi:hypothetical protein
MVGTSAIRHFSLKAACQDTTPKQTIEHLLFYPEDGHEGNMRIRSMAILMLCAAASSNAHATDTNVQHIWFYQTADHPSWCAVTDEVKARAIAASERFASGSSAILVSRAGHIVSLTLTTDSEDASVDDTYTFGKDLKVTELVRRGHYINDPYFSVTFVLNASGSLELTAPSKQRVRQQEGAGHETYWVDWPRYHSVQELPFANTVRLGPSILVLRRCSARAN